MDIKKYLEELKQTFTDPRRLKQYCNEVWQNNKGFIAAVIAIFVVRSIVVDQYHVPSGSMEPAIQVGDRVLVNKMAYQLRIPFTSQTITKLNDPERGDIVVFDHPDYKVLQPQKSFDDRGIALFGDTIKFGLNEADLFEATSRENIKTIFAEMYFKNGLPFLKKIDSSKEVLIDGKPITETEVSSSQTISVDSNEFVFTVYKEVDGLLGLRKTMVKRLVGLPGDRIAINRGKFFVNGEPTTVGILANPTKPFYEYFKENVGKYNVVVQRDPRKANSGMLPDFMEFTVPSDSYFFMGDNRDDSADSRFWGFVPRSLLRGKALNVTFSLDGYSPRWSRFGQSLYKDLTTDSLQ